MKPRMPQPDAEETSRQIGQGASLFTRRQEQVVGCLAAGMIDTEMGVYLSISPRTVRMHCDTVRARLAVSHRRQIPLAYKRRTGRDPLHLFPGSDSVPAIPETQSVNLRP